MDSQFQEFPKFKHHPAKGAKLVNGPEQEAALGAGWHDNPLSFPVSEQPAGLDAASEPAPEPTTDAPTPEPTIVAPPAKPTRKKKAE